MDSTYYEVGYVDDGFYGLLKSADALIESSTNLVANGVRRKGTYFVYDYTDDGYTLPASTLENSGDYYIDGYIDESYFVTRDSASVEFSAEFQLTALGGHLLEATADLACEFQLVADPRELNIDTFVYTVPRESRVYTVQAETRTWRVQ